LFSTGFKKDSELMASLAETVKGRTISVLTDFSKKANIAICGSFVCRENENIFNRAFFITPENKTYFYDKHHLFSMGGEHNIFSAGSSAPDIIEFKGWKIMTAVCYDLRFPAWLRNTGLKYDLLIIPANWAHSRVYAWKHLLIARAIENQAFVIGCNRSGEDEYGEYPVEDTFAFNNWGKEICTNCESGIIYCTLDGEKLMLDRERFSPWKDADTFIYF
ncbi:MAG: nitrilase family protein, partial [Paramuribaculum sp.]|nr:nitrilase family protein [Paramuribaculum sp.]